MFQGFANLAFIAPDGTEYKPGDEVELDDETEAGKQLVDQFLAMSVIRRTNPAAAPEQPARRTRAQARMEERAARERAAQEG